MFANVVIDGSVQGYRYNEQQSAAAFSALEKVAGLAGALIQAGWSSRSASMRRRLTGSNNRSQVTNGL